MQTTDHYVKNKWPHQDGISIVFGITRNFSSKPHLTVHMRIAKEEMMQLHELYFEVVHKMFVPIKERKMQDILT